MGAQKHDEASKIFLSVLKENPDHFLAVEQLGIVSEKLGQRDKALSLMQSVTEIAPTYAHGYYSLARTLKMAQRYADAGQALGMCLQLNANDKKLLQDAAHLFEELGLQEKAAETYRRLYEVTGSVLSIYGYLTHDHKFTGVEDPYFVELKKVESDLSQLKSTGEKSTFYYLLAKAHDDMKDYDTAFSYMAKGAETKRSDIEYDVEGHISWLEKTQKYFTPELIAQYKGKGFLTKKPVFIVGMPRCGSTLLDQILCSHANIKSIGESPALHYLIQNHLMMPVHGGIEFPSKPRSTPHEIEKIGEEYLRQMNAHNLKAERIVDKALINHAYIGLIKIMFPNAKILHCMRDAMDCCVSCFSIAFNRNSHLYTYDLVELGRVYCAYRNLMGYWHEIMPGAILDVHYEEIVEDPETQIRRVLDFLEMPWDENCLRFHETERSVRSASISQVRKPLYKSSVKKWMRYKKHLGPLIEALGPYAQTSKD